MSAEGSPRAGRLDIAIVGIGCRFPGGVVDVASFWRFLCEGREGVGEIPPDRMEVAALFEGPAALPGKISANRGGYLERIDEFDAAFFGISPREAALLDPQQRLLLETAWEALEDAGENIARLSESVGGVFVGQWTSDFEGRLFSHPEAMDFYAVQGSGRYAASGRVSYALGLRGPSVTLDTACSSSLVAVHLAARSLQAGECDLAVAGGVNIILQPHVSIAYSQSRMLSGDGKCKFGDASGDGYVRSEGAAIVVLKPLARARADGDRVYAVIRGSAVRNDGASSGSMGTPSQAGQEALLRAAYESAAIAPTRVGYVEAHGTGTRAGDPVELKAIAATVGRGRAQDQPIYVGSAKTNWGHTEAAAGAAGLIKAALVLHHGRIPASLHRSTPNPLLSPAELALLIPGELTPFPHGPEPGVVGVTALGISGTNAHVVLEAAPPPQDVVKPPVPWAPATLLPLSARSPQALRRLASLMADRLAACSQEEANDVCWTAARRRASLTHRAAFAAESHEALLERLRDFATGEEAISVVFGDARPKICFVCPGQGAQWAGMARRLMADHPSFRAALEECDRAASAFVDFSLIGQLLSEPGQAGYRLDEIRVIQPVLVALSIAYARLLQAFGITPDAVVGHSMGEVAAAAIAGVLDTRQAMEIVTRRSALMQRSSGLGAMCVVELPMSEAAKRLKGREDKVNIAVKNSPRSCVISGDPDTMQAVIAELQVEGVFCRPVKVDVASHSPQMESAATILVGDLDGLSTQEARVPIWSTVLGRRASGPEFDAAYWGRNLRETVLFADALESLLEDGVMAFVELGPHPVLLHAVAETAKAKGTPVTTSPCGRREEQDNVSFLSALGRLWTLNGSPAWDRIAPGGKRAVDVPLYPWQREKHWADIARRSASARPAHEPSTPFDDETRSWLYAQTWVKKDLPRSPPSGSPGPFLFVGAEAPGALADVFASAGAQLIPTSWARLDQAIASEGHRAAGLLVALSSGEAAAYEPILALQALLKSGGAGKIRLWVLSRGAAWPADSSAQRVCVDHAAAWGASRAIAEEHPNLWGGLIDLGPGSSSQQGLALAVAQILAADGEDQIAVRGAQRYVLRLQPKAVDDSTEPFCARRDGAYLITGGFGDIGLDVARKLVSRGARRLILMGRTETPPRRAWADVDPASRMGGRLAAIRELEASGVAVHLAAVDVSDESALREYLERYRAEAWPPIRGVVHAAGALDDALAETIDRSRFESLLGPKLRGAAHLDRLLPGLDLFVLISSTASLLPQTGQASYAAANAGLDAMAQDRRARGAPCVSIGWGVWRETGLMGGGDAGLKLEAMERQGMRSIPRTRGADLIPWLLSWGEPTLTVLPMNWLAFAAARVARPHRVFENNIAAAEARNAGAPAPEPSSGADLEQTVRKALGAVLKIAPARIDPRSPLGAMGLTSLMAIELRNLLEASLKRPLSATLAWNHPTVEAMVAYLGAPSEQAPAASVEIAEPAAVAGFEELEQLSDAEAFAALRRTAGAA